MTTNRRSRYAAHSRRLLAPVGIVALAACAHTAFDREFERGHVEEAIRVFDADSSLARDPNALFRAAAARATPGSPVYNPNLARTELQLLIDRFPGSPHRVEARRLDALLAELQRASDNAARLSARIDSLSVRMDSANARVAEHRRGAQQLQADLRRTQAELQEVRHELERLKAIDLQLSGHRSRDR